jgi:hypothetical protein
LQQAQLERPFKHSHSHNNAALHITIGVQRLALIEGLAVPWHLANVA